MSFITLFASILIILASPIPITYGGELSEISKTKRLNHVGKATWFYPGLGSCGRTNTKSDFIVGIGKALYDEIKAKTVARCSLHSPLSQEFSAHVIPLQYMEIVNTSNGKKTYAQVVDRCPGCGTNDLRELCI
ncbi:hypothetical protein BDQ17DRAFT_1441019 [Cyathus striatus]|nr:hypothetical protein BDQ17DRAFT_1441019 [Cyathus striatus]